MVTSFQLLDFSWVFMAFFPPFKPAKTEVFSIISFLETALYSAIYFLIVVIAPWSQDLRMQAESQFDFFSLKIK